jgi:hypothetical protein
MPIHSFIHSFIMYVNGVGHSFACYRIYCDILCLKELEIFLQVSEIRSYAASLGLRSVFAIKADATIAVKEWLPDVASNKGASPVEANNLTEGGREAFEGKWEWDQSVRYFFVNILGKESWCLSSI